MGLLRRNINTTHHEKTQDFLKHTTTIKTSKSFILKLYELLLPKLRKSLDYGWKGYCTGNDMVTLKIYWISAFKLVNLYKLS